MEDLGAKFSKDRSFCFDHIFIHEIIFDESNDVTLFCTVPYFGKNYAANFGLTFDQLNIILRNTSKPGEKVAGKIAERLEAGIEIPSIIEVEMVYGQPLELNNFVFYTTLYDIGDDEDLLDIEDIEDLENFKEEEEEDDNEFEAYAFLIDDIVVKNKS